MTTHCPQCGAELAEITTAHQVVMVVHARSLLRSCAAHARFVTAPARAAERRVKEQAERDADRQRRYGDPAKRTGFTAPELGITR